MTRDNFEIFLAAVSFIGGHLAYLEILCRRSDQRRKQFHVARVTVMDFNRSNDVSAYAAHQMDLYPIVLLSLYSVFVIVPAMKARGCEAGTVCSKVTLDSL